ncbi:hypothetical protein KR084_009269 [Drosophila pseudotakahashii]|nr:hypothetical protein KR084_009269 [Drosophila pseudotakahashii]
MLPRPGGSGKSKDDSSMAAALEVVIVHSPASKEQRLIGGQEASGCCRRKRNNATQTRLAGGSCCCVITTHHHHCHCNHRHHHHHHCHYRSTKRRALLHQKRSHHHHNHNQHLQVKQSNHKQMLPSNNNKSSLDSSEEAMHHQAIAIEIDAATMSEDGDENNSSTATSNFPYKVASEGVKPIIMAPLREQHRHRRGSLNSNTTIETDELSHDEDDDDVRMGSHHLPEDETQLTQPAITNSSSSSTKRGNPASAPARNECVRIKRKRFIAEAGQDYCSSCSSSCSCSSLDEDLDAHHEMTVSAECHQCIPGSRRASFCSCHNSTCCCGSCSQEEDEEEEADDEDDETTGQRESFCTAADHTITPSQEGEDMHSSTLTPLSTQRSSFMEQDHGDHTMRSDNGGGNLTDADASSLSQSAEYFSLSSTAGGGASFPIKEEDKKEKLEKKEVKDLKEKEVEPPSCKHWNRNPHGKHKRGSSPVDNSL